MKPSNRMITVNLGDFQEYVEKRIGSGDYASVSELLRDALRLHREEQTGLRSWLRHKADSSGTPEQDQTRAQQQDVLGRLRVRHLTKAGVRVEDDDE